MAFETRPWFIGLDGVEHSAETARMLAWAATSGATGIIKPRDLQVVAQTVPGPSVSIRPGGYAVESTYGGAAQQTYVGRAPTTTDLEVPATGSSGGATRYVVAAVLDPSYPGGGTAPDIPNEGVYQTPMLVDSLSQPFPVVPLARINQPRNTSAITNDMITDLREVANPRRKEYVFGRPRVVADSSAGVRLSMRTADGGEYFPGGNGSPNQFQVEVPDWATRVHVDASWMGVWRDYGDAVWGSYWVEWGDEYRDRTWPNNKQWEFSTQHFGFNFPNTSDGMRQTWQLMDALYIPARMRGKTVTFAFKAGLATDADYRGVGMDSLSGLGMRLTFAEVADSIHLV